MTLGHEWHEMMSDQNPAGGWTNHTGSSYNGQENSGECAWLAPGTAGGAANISFGSFGTYAEQSSWSNGTNSCAISVKVDRELLQLGEYLIARGQHLNAAKPAPEQAPAEDGIPDADLVLDEHDAWTDALHTLEAAAAKAQVRREELEEAFQLPPSRSTAAWAAAVQPPGLPSAAGAPSTTGTRRRTRRP